MAKFNEVGLDAVIDDMMRQPEAMEEAVPEVLSAQAEILVRAQKAQAQAMHIRKTGDFIDSISATQVKKNKDGESYVDVYPQGTNRHGVRNAEVGFIAEYGTSKIKPRRWMETANEKASGDMASKAMEVWDKYSNKGGTE